MSTCRDWQTRLHGLQFFQFQAQFQGFFHTNHVRVVFSTAPIVFPFKNWLSFSSVLIRPISSFTFDEGLILIFSAFNDSTQLFNLSQPVKEYQPTIPFQNHPPITRISPPHFSKSTILPSHLTNKSAIPSFPY